MQGHDLNITVTEIDLTIILPNRKIMVKKAEVF